MLHVVHVVVLSVYLAGYYGDVFMTSLIIIRHMTTRFTTEFSQEKCIEYIHCFYDVNEMVYIIITIINISLILYHVFLPR